MKLPAWTKKVFAPVFSSSTSTPISDTPPIAAFTPLTLSTTNDDLSKPKGSIQSYLTFSTLPAVKKRIHFHDVLETNTNANPTSTSSLMGALFFGHVRNPCTTASSPEMSKPSGQLQDSKPTLVVDIQKSNKDDTNDDGEGDDESYHDLDSPATTTIYYHPPSPRESPETSPFPSPTSDTVNSPLTAKSDHKLWCLRHHISLLPSASASSPEFHHLRQHYHHFHHHRMYHDKDCEYARRSAVEPGQRHATTQHCKKQEEYLSPMSPLPSASSVPKIKSAMVSVPPHCPPTRFEVRRSSANYSLEALKNEKRSNRRSSSRASVSTNASTSRNGSTNSLISSNPRRHVHSEETIRELRESIKCMSHFGFAPFSSLSSSASKKSTSSKVQIAPKAAPTVAVSNSDALPTGITVIAPTSRVRPPGPRNSPLASRPIEVSTPDAMATTTTTTTTVTTTTTAPVSTNINGYEQLIKKVDTLAREVEIMKQQHHYTLTSTAITTPNNNNNTGSSVAANPDTLIQVFRTTTSRRNPSTVSLPLPTITENSNLRQLATKNNSASLSSSFLPVRSSTNNNNNTPTPTPPAPAVRKNSGNKKPLTHRNSYYRSNNSMTCLQNLPPPPSEQPPSPPSLPYSSSSSSSSLSSSPSQRDNTPQRQNSLSPLPPSRIPIPFPRPNSEFRRSSSLLFPSPSTIPTHTAVATTTTTCINTSSANNVNSRLMTTIATTAMTLDNDIIMPLSFTTETGSSMTTSIATTHSDDATSIAPPLTSNDDNDHNNDITKKQQTQEQQGWEKDKTPTDAMFLSRTRSLTPTPQTVPPPPPPPPRSYLTKTSPIAQTITGLTGPPRRPPRPPQLGGMDMKEILSLMDSRLAALPGVPPPVGPER